MRAVILAAGLGSRIWPLAESRPKHILPVAGRPLIYHLVKALSKNSIREICIVTGGDVESFKSALGNIGQKGLRIRYLRQDNPTGTASALQVARRTVDGERFLALYGDLWIDPSVVRRVIKEGGGSERVIAVTPVKDGSEYGTVIFTKKKLRGVLEKRRARRGGEVWINAGIYIFDKEIFSDIDETRQSNRGEYELSSSLNRLLRRGKGVRVVKIPRESWVDVGRPWDLISANEKALTRISSSVGGTVESGSVVREPVVIEKNATVRSGSYVEGPVFIGRNTFVGPNARIRPYTSIGENAVIGTSCEVKNSIIMDGAKIPHLSYVGDSILGFNCNIGAGTVTANLRFDEQNVRMRIDGRLLDTGRKKLGAIFGDGAQTGVNVSLMPGVRVGSGAWIGPGLVIQDDVRSGEIVLAQYAALKRKLSGSKRASGGSHQA